MPTWTFTDYPGITPDRLLVVGARIRDVRNEAVDDHRSAKGETNWSLGVRQYERTCSALSWASIEFPWLTVVSGGLGAVQYVFAIGGHPIRFCRGDEEEITARYREPCFPEMIQQQTFFGSSQGRWLRIVIENGPECRPAVIRLMEIDADGVPVHFYVIPEVTVTTTITPFTPPSEPPVQIPPVVAEATDDAEQQNQDEDKTGSDDE